MSVGTWIMIGIAGLSSFACSRPTTPPEQPGATASMTGMMQLGNLTPPVKGFYKGEQVIFIHTEASDPQVASMLTRMMGPQVLLVPGLAKTPHELLANKGSRGRP